MLGGARVPLLCSTVDPLMQGMPVGGGGSPGGAVVELRVLGPVQLWAAGRPVELGPARQRTVLAALALDAGRPLPVDTVIDRVWDENPPGGARAGPYSLYGDGPIDRQAVSGHCLASSARSSWMAR